MNLPFMFQFSVTFIIVGWLKRNGDQKSVPTAHIFITVNGYKIKYYT